MRRPDDHDEALRALLKSHAIRPSEEQAARLKQIITTTYQKTESVSLSQNQWPARLIVLLAIVSCGLLLSRGGAALVSPVIMMILSLTASIWMLIFLSSRIITSRFTHPPLSETRRPIK